MTSVHRLSYHMNEKITIFSEINQKFKIDNSELDKTRIDFFNRMLFIF